MNKLNKLLLVSIAALFLLSACGQNGPLYLPESETDQSVEETTEEYSDESS